MQNQDFSMLLFNFNKISGIIPVKVADVAGRALHVEVEWDVVGPHPTRGVHRGMKVRREAEHHNSAGRCLFMGVRLTAVQLY